MKFAIGHLLEVVWFARVPVLKSERFPSGHPEEPAKYKKVKVKDSESENERFPCGHPEEPVTYWTL